MPIAFSYPGGPGGEMVLKPIEQSGRPWDIGTYSDIDEIIRDDSDFIQSRPLGKSAQDLVDFKFSPGLDAHQNFDHVLRLVYKEGSIGTNHPHLTLTLREGGNVIEEWTYYDLPTVFTVAEHTISPTNIEKISDYANLYITIRAWCDNTCTSTPGSKDVVQISWLDFSYHKTRKDDPNLLPSVIGIGIYQIEQNNVMYPYSENIMTLNKESIFSTYQPYSKLSDETDILRYGTIDDYEKFGTFFFVGDENTFVPLTTGILDRPVQLQILVHDNFQSEQIEHVGLSAVLSGQYSKQKAHLFEIDLDKGKNAQIIDQHKILKDVFTSWSVEDGYLWANIDLTFQQILPKSDFVIQVWDQNRIAKEFKILDVLQVSKSNYITPSKNIDLTADVVVSHDASSPVCKLNFQCFTPFNAKILKTGIVTWINHDEIVHSIVSGDGKPNNRFSYYVFPGQSVQHRFDVAGEYNYFCDLHPWARGKVTVIDQDNTALQSSEKTDTPPLLVYSVSSSGSLLVENNDLVIKENRDLWFEITGNISEDIHMKRVDLEITTPDDSKKILHVSANEKGYYRVPVILNEKWISGKYTVMTKVDGIEIGKVSFMVKATK